MKVSTILDQVDYGQLALPQFQRGYVWSRKQVRDLMESLYRGYPIGGLLIWITTADAAAIRGDRQITISPIRLLLDGQQRVTSLYGIIRGKAPPFFDGNDNAFKGLHFDVRDETFEFYGPVKMRDDPRWVNVSELFQAGKPPANLVPYSYENHEYISRVYRLLSIRDRQLHEEEITGTQLDEVVEIFNRQNSSGTTLSKGDLALAHLCTLWPEARDKMRAQLDEWQRAGFKFSLNWLLRVTNAVLTGEADLTVLRDLDRRTFERGLNKSVVHCDSLLNLIADQLGLDHARVLPGVSAFPVMARVLELNGSLDSNDESRMLFWYLHASLRGRFSVSTETTLAQDLRVAEQSGIDGLIDHIAAWRPDLNVTPADFAGANRGSRFYPLLYLLSRVGGARDLVSGRALSHHMLGRYSSLELHHIFPKSMLDKRGYDIRERNALGNFCFLTKSSNLTIGKQEPSEYLAEYERRHPGVLESQWIPVDHDLWQPENYEKFLERRRELLSAAANEVLDNLRIGYGVDDEGRHPRPEPSVPRPGPDSQNNTSQIKPIDPDTDPIIQHIIDKCHEHLLPTPEVDYSIVHPDTAEDLAWADLAWPDGLQEGLTEPVAYLLEPDTEMQMRLGELGYRYFTDDTRLIRHMESVYGIDIDGDNTIGEPTDEDLEVEPSRPRDTGPLPERPDPVASHHDQEPEAKLEPEPKPVSEGTDTETPSQPISPPEPGSASPSKPRKTRRVINKTRSVKVKELINAGLLEVGAQLTWERRKQGATYRALVLDNGHLQLADGSTYSSPSRAAMEAAGVQSRNGWKAWQTTAGDSLLDLRAKLLRDEQAQREEAIKEPAEEVNAGFEGGTADGGASLPRTASQVNAGYRGGSVDGGASLPRTASRANAVFEGPTANGEASVARTASEANAGLAGGTANGDTALDSSDPKLSRRRRKKRPSRGSQSALKGVSNAEHELAILQVLVDLGGSGKTSVVVPRVGELIHRRLAPKDLKLNKRDIPNWEYQTHWRRSDMADKGEIRDDSKRGTWEISAAGRARLENSGLTK